MTPNPYEPPIAELDASMLDSSKFEDVGRIVVDWEKLRFIYNAVLVVFTLLVIAFTGARNGLVGTFIQVCAGAIFANVCFCAGPIVNGYLAWFGMQRRELTLVLFVLGTLFTMGLVVVGLVFLV